MTRQEATQDLRDLLNKYGLTDWHIRLNTDSSSRFLGLCSHKDKTIILSAHHIDIHPTPDVKNTNRHEVAHALVGPFNGHNQIWVDKAREIGCDNTSPCSNLELNPSIIDAIRAGADVEVTFDEKKVIVPIAFEEQIIRTPKYSVTRLQDKCEYCGKVAKTDHDWNLITGDDKKFDWKFIRLECSHLLVKRIPKGTPFHTFQFGGDPSCEHVWVKNNCVLCSRKRPYDFQLEGMKFGEAALAVNHGVAIFDEMGLGKTIQAGGLLKFHPEYQSTLWIVKSALQYQFAMFIIKWMGKDHIPWIISSSKDEPMPGFKNYIISYDMMVPKSKTLKSGRVINSGFDIKKFDDLDIKSVVLDECQQIKNVDSARTQMVRRVVKGKKVIALSGTPWNNRGSELFPVLNMLDPMKFNSEEGFKTKWVSYFWQGAFRKEGGIKNIKYFREYTKDICIRRERAEVMPELPLINRTKLYVKMDPEKQESYDVAVDDFVKWFEEQSGNLGGMAIIAAMAKMRHLVALAKIDATQEYVNEFIEETDRKIVVFAHHKDVQDMLFDYFKSVHSDIPVLKFVSGMDSSQVHTTQTIFNESKQAILVASTIAAGEGLNLQTCCDCVLHERMWNPGREEQAESRFIRIGSVSTSVSAIYAHMEGLTAIDSTLDGIVERKRYQFHDGMNKGEMPQWNEDSLMKELAETIVNAHNAKKNKKILTTK